MKAVMTLTEYQKKRARIKSKTYPTRKAAEKAIEKLQKLFSDFCAEHHLDGQTWSSITKVEFKK
jgi:hypothetical protein